MRIWDQIKSVFSAKQAVTPLNLTTYPYNNDGTRYEFVDSRSKVAGQLVTDGNLLTHDAVYHAVYVLASGVASIDLNIVEYLKGGGKKIDYEHDFYELLAVQPNPDIPSGRALIETLMVHLLTTGNAYVYLLRNQLRGIIGLYPLNPRLVTSFRDKDGVKWYRLPGYDPIPQADIVHISTIGFDGQVGISPLQYLRSIVGVARALDDFSASFFANGCNVKGVLQSPTSLSDEAQDNLRSSYEAVHAGAGNGSKMLILEEGLKFTPTTIAPNEAQFNESIKSQILRIGMAFNLPPTSMGIYDHTALNTLEETNQNLMFSVFLPWVERIRNAFNLKFFPTRDERKVWGVEYDDSNALAGKMLDKVEVWEKLYNMRVIDTNWMKAELGLPPIPNGDIPLVQANNLRPLDQVVHDFQNQPSNQATQGAN